MQILDGACIIYDWKTGPDYLIRRVIPGMHVRYARIADHPAEVLASLRSDCRLFLFHINLTRSGIFLPDRQEFVCSLRKRSIQPLNAFATDISKRALHAACRSLGLRSTLAEAEGPPRELLIVKTNLNYGGVNERKLSASQQRQLGLPPPSPAVQLLAGHEYPVLLRKDIPPDWWHDEQLVIEQFIENRGQRIGRVHFLLDSGVVSYAICRSMIKKMNRNESFVNFPYTRGQFSETVPEHPEVLNETIALCGHLGVDFGAVDFVIDDHGRHYFIDVNPTAYGGPRKSSIYDSMRAGLASLAPVRR